MKPFYDDLAEALDVEPDEHTKRAIRMLKASVRNRELEMAQAIEDFTEAIRLEAQDATIYANRGLALPSPLAPTKREEEEEEADAAVTCQKGSPGTPKNWRLVFPGRWERALLKRSLPLLT